MCGFTRQGCGRSSYRIKPCSCALFTAFSILSVNVSFALRAFSNPSSTTSFARPMPSSTTSFAFSSPSSTRRQPLSITPERPASRTASALASTSAKMPSINLIPTYALASKLSRVAKTSLYPPSRVSTSTLALRRPAPISSPDTCEHESRTASRVAYARLIPASSCRLR